MMCARLASDTDFEGWRRAARALRLADVRPDRAVWRVGSASGLLDGPPPPEPDPALAFSISRAFVALAEDVILHSAAERFDLLYRLLWRARNEPHLMSLVTDPEVSRAGAMQKQVRDAEHKMHAFTRFRRLEGGDANQPETYVAWFEPPHHVVQRGAEFFVDRMANLRFSILTPDVCAHWDGHALRFTPGVERSAAPGEDALESYWSTYFSAVFNPARLNVELMTRQMPRRYWRNMPEASCIPEMIADARERAEAMVLSNPSEPSARVRRLASFSSQPVFASKDTMTELPNGPGSLGEMAAALETCRRCELWRNATQAVGGQGPASASLMFVGEQPGDLEDLEGRPFVGPAGELFDRALGEAKVSRQDCYVTNAVKHFKWEPRGKRRLHKRPDAGEIQACRWWLEQERDQIRPKVIVALGATAAFSLFGRSISVTKTRGPAGLLGNGAVGFVTVHPSYLLRLPDAKIRAAEYARFVLDLASAYALSCGLEEPDGQLAQNSDESLSNSP